MSSAASPTERTASAIGSKVRAIATASACRLLSNSITALSRWTSLELTQVQSAYNIPTTGRGPHHFISTGLVTLLKSVDPRLPYNGGFVRPIRSVLPEGSVVNPRKGAAIGVRAATMHRIYDVTMGCVAQALPDVIPAAGGGQGARSWSWPFPTRLARQSCRSSNPYAAARVADQRSTVSKETTSQSAAAGTFLVRSWNKTCRYLSNVTAYCQTDRAGRHRGGLGLELEFQFCLKRRRSHAVDSSVTRRGPGDAWR